MWLSIAGGLALGGGAPIVAHAEEVPIKGAPDPAPKTPAKKPRVEVVFVLDTTGSMTGMIEGAKAKIWSIATAIATGKSKPDVAIGLVAYRDRGDEYVTKVTPLTEDLDKVYGDLKSFRADGGGDLPEDVRAGLDAALGKIKWSQDKETLKIIFLVGDAPPHMDYQDEPTVDEICKKAVTAGVIINTVRCGGDQDCERIFGAIARKSEGRFFTVDQTGGVVVVATPYDKDLGALNDKMGGTLLAYGDTASRSGAMAREAEASAMAAPSKADRACGKAAGARYSSDDLVDALKEKRVALDKIAVAELPEAMKNMKPEERQAYVEAKAKERDELRAKIVELARKRDAFIAEELKKKGVKDTFDEVTLAALKEQAKAKGIELTPAN
jgi:Mg-chelatase subunit ChlD